MSKKIERVFRDRRLSPAEVARDEEIRLKLHAEFPTARKNTGSGAAIPMPICVALLRGINVGGRNLVAMSELRDLFEGLGFTNVRSLLQSGNLIFKSERRTSAAIERLLEGETEKRLGVAVDYHVRTADEWKTVIDRNPFPAEAERDPAHLVVAFMKDAPQEKNVEALQAAIRGPEILCADGRQLYIVYPAGIGTSKLTNNVIDKNLGVRGTARNWNTVLKLAALLQE